MDVIEDKVIEENKVIALFMGGDFDSEFDCYKFPEPMGFRTDDWCYDFELQYHQSWDWLMPVIEKIENLIEVERINNPKIAYYYLSQGKIHMMGQEGEVMFSCSPDSSKKRIQRNWECCVAFINWFNQIK